MNISKLTITLIDYIDNVVYSKEYQESDIGGEIHRKMELEDVYDALAYSKNKSDAIKMEERSIHKKSKEYKFGDIVLWN